MPTVSYLKGLAVHAKAVVLTMLRMKTHLAQRNGMRIRTKMEKGVKRSSYNPYLELITISSE